MGRHVPSLAGDLAGANVGRVCGWSTRGSPAEAPDGWTCWRRSWPSGERSVLTGGGRRRTRRSAPSCDPQAPPLGATGPKHHVNAVVHVFSEAHAAIAPDAPPATTKSRPDRPELGVARTGPAQDQPDVVLWSTWSRLEQAVAWPDRCCGQGAVLALNPMGSARGDGAAVGLGAVVCGPGPCRPGGAVLGRFGVTAGACRPARRAASPKGSGDSASRTSLVGTEERAASVAADHQGKGVDRAGSQRPVPSASSPLPMPSVPTPSSPSRSSSAGRDGPAMRCGHSHAPGSRFVGAPINRIRSVALHRWEMGGDRGTGCAVVSNPMVRPPTEIATIRLLSVVQARVRDEPVTVGSTITTGGVVLAMRRVRSGPVVCTRCAVATFAGGGSVARRSGVRSRFTFNPPASTAQPGAGEVRSWVNKPTTSRFTPSWANAGDGGVRGPGRYRWPCATAPRCAP